MSIQKGGGGVNPREKSSQIGPSWQRSLSCFIDVVSVGDPQDNHIISDDREDDAVIADPIFPQSRKMAFKGRKRAGIFRQILFDAIQYPSCLCLVDS